VSNKLDFRRGVKIANLLRVILDAAFLHFVILFASITVRCRPFVVVRLLFAVLRRNFVVDVVFERGSKLLSCYSNGP